MFGYKKSNRSPILRLLLSRLDALIARSRRRPNQRPHSRAVELGILRPAVAFLGPAGGTKTEIARGLDEISDVQIIVRSQQVRFTFHVVDIQRSGWHAETGTLEAKGAGRHRASKRRAAKVDTMKTSMLIKILAALAIGAAFPLGAIAAQPSKTMTQRGVIEKVKAPRKHYFAHPWLES